MSGKNTKRIAELGIDLEKVSQIAQKHDLSLVVLFGSQATGKTHAKSDVDIAVLSTSPVDRVNIGGDMEDVFQREDVEIVDLSAASPTTIYVVVRDGLALYEKEIGLFAKWKLYAMREWRDTERYRILRDRKLTEWAKTS